MLCYLDVARATRAINHVSCGPQIIVRRSTLSTCSGTRRWLAVGGGTWWSGHRPTSSARFYPRCARYLPSRYPPLESSRPGSLSTMQCCSSHSMQSCSASHFIASWCATEGGLTHASACGHARQLHASSGWQSRVGSLLAGTAASSVEPWTWFTVDVRDAAEAQIRLAEDSFIRPFTHADGGKCVASGGCFLLLLSPLPFWPP